VVVSVSHSLVLYALWIVCVLQAEIEAGVDLNLRNKDGKTACMLAAGAGHPEVLSSMKRGPSLANIATDDGGTPLMSACCHGRFDALEVRPDYRFFIP